MSRYSFPGLQRHTASIRNEVASILTRNFKDTLARVAGKPKILILRMRKVPAMDATGLHTLTDVVRRSRKDGTLVLLSGVQPQPRETLRRSVLLDEIGEENICATFDEALARAHEELEVERLLGGPGGREAVA